MPVNMATTHVNKPDDSRLQADLKSQAFEDFEADGDETISSVEGRRIRRRVDLRYVVSNSEP